MPVFAALEKKRSHTVSAAPARKTSAAPRRARATSKPLNAPSVAQAFTFAGESTVSGFNRLPASAQAKLSISVPSDALEQEADRVADAVLRDQADGASITVGGRVGMEISRKCASCEEREDAAAVTAPEPEDTTPSPTRMAGTSFSVPGNTRPKAQPGVEFWRTNSPTSCNSAALRHLWVRRDLLTPPSPRQCARLRATRFIVGPSVASPRTSIPSSATVRVASGSSSAPRAMPIRRSASAPACGLTR